MQDRTADREQRVTSLELFFDLVFVFAITQVTGMLSHDPTWDGLESIRYREGRARLRAQRGAAAS